MRLACIEGKPVFLSFFGDVKETAAASELQRERERGECVLRASLALVSPIIILVGLVYRVFHPLAVLELGQL